MIIIYGKLKYKLWNVIKSLITTAITIAIISIKYAITIKFLTTTINKQELFKQLKCYSLQFNELIKLINVLKSNVLIVTRC